MKPGEVPYPRHPLWVLDLIILGYSAYLTSISLGAGHGAAAGIGGLAILAGRIVNEIVHGRLVRNWLMAQELQHQFDSDEGGRSARTPEAPGCRPRTKRTGTTTDPA